MRVLAASLLLAIVVSACGLGPAASSQGKLKVVTTTTILADLTANVAGDRATVASIAPKGAHVEDFEPRPEDAKQVGGARLVLVNGAGLDAWAEDILRNAPQDAKVVVVTQGLPGLNDEKGEVNPHFWFDVKLVKAYVEKIRDALIEIDGAGRDGYASRATSYLASLDDLDREVRAEVAKVPAAKRKLVTSHDAFPYFARAYGFDVIGFTQPQPGSEPSAGELADLVKNVRAANVPAVFVESGVSPAVSQALAREAGVRSVITDLPTDSLLDPPADTYLGLMRTVVKKIVDALR